MRKKKWNEEKTRALVEMYPNHTNAEIAEALGVTEPAVCAKASSLGLRKDKDWAREKSSQTWFRPGTSPPNKGKKWDEVFTPEQQERIKANTFKPGHRPWNAIKVGEERKTTDGYWRVKVAEPNVFKFKHRLLWEEHHGPIPKGMVISFIDGNPDNVVIENLQMETRTQKFMRCGCTHTTLPPDIRKLVQLKGALKRQINKIKD